MKGNEKVANKLTHFFLKTIFCHMLCRFAPVDLFNKFCSHFYSQLQLLSQLKSRVFFTWERNMVSFLPCKHIHFRLILSEAYLLIFCPFECHVTNKLESQCVYTWKFCYEFFSLSVDTQELHHFQRFFSSLYWEFLHELVE